MAARTLDQVVQDIGGNLLLQIAKLTATTEAQADTIRALEAENAALKAGKPSN